jgi:uncharacterized protein YbjT (DUF2867 family)
MGCSRMKVILFGGSGMLGQGVLREMLSTADVERVLIVARTSAGISHPKVEELEHRDFADFEGVASRLTGFDACLYCLGASAAGMTERDYRHVTYDFALAAASVLARVNPAMVLVYVSGAGTDSSEKGRSMWARVKGETENALLRLPFKAQFMFRPAYIHPTHGERSKTASYRVFYAATGWLFPLLKRAFRGQVTTTEEVARAMLRVVREGAPASVLESADIVRLGAPSMAPARAEGQSRNTRQNVLERGSRLRKG